MQVAAVEELIKNRPVHREVCQLGTLSKQEGTLNCDSNSQIRFLGSQKTILRGFDRHGGIHCGEMNVYSDRQRGYTVNGVKLAYTGSWKPPLQEL